MTSTEDLRQCLQEKLSILTEMRTDSKRLLELLSGDELGEENMADVDALLERRDSNIASIDHLNIMVGQIGSKVESREITDIKLNIRDVISDLIQLQNEIDHHMQTHKAFFAARIKDIGKRRQGLKGYYDKTTASRSRFIDDRK